MFEVSAALLKLLAEAVPPHLPPEAIHQPNAFRQHCCYTEEARNPNPNPNPSPNPKPNPNPNPNPKLKPNPNPNPGPNPTPILAPPFRWTV